MLVTLRRPGFIDLLETLRSLVAHLTSWFHAEEIGRNDTDQRYFYTSANYTVIASPTDAKSGSTSARVAK